MTETYVTVNRDGEVLVGPFSENLAFEWLLRHQTKSVDLAIAEEGYSFEPAEWDVMLSDDVLIGRKANGEKVYASANLQRRSGTFQTTTHESVTREILVFSASGHSLSANQRHDSDNWMSGGQMLDELLEITTPAPGWTMEEIKAFHRLWKNWHLNDMKAGCVHQPSPVYKEGRYGQEIDLENTPACPETGYRYGHAWLYRPIPATVVVEMQTLIRKIRAS